MNVHLPDSRALDVPRDYDGILEYCRAHIADSDVCLIEYALTFVLGEAGDIVRRYWPKHRAYLRRHGIKSFEVRAYPFGYFSYMEEQFKLALVEFGYRRGLFVEEADPQRLSDELLVLFVGAIERVRRRVRAVPSLESEEYKLALTEQLQSDVARDRRRWDRPPWDKPKSRAERELGRAFEKASRVPTSRGRAVSLPNVGLLPFATKKADT